MPQNYWDVGSAGMALLSCCARARRVCAGAGPLFKSRAGLVKLELAGHTRGNDLAMVYLLWLSERAAAYDYTHNEIREITASHLTKVCNIVATEPTLSGERMTARSANTDDGSRADICARG